MISILVSMDERVACEAIGQAASLGMTFSEYAEWRLSFPLDQSISTQPAESQQTATEIAEEIFLYALDKPVSAIGKEGARESNEYLVEALYKQKPFTTDWNELDHGIRAMIGKAFKRRVDEQSVSHAAMSEPKNNSPKVVFVRRSPHNQAIYLTKDVQRR
ncbi:hypothetical protein SAMN06265795_104291 [Noviherbaspirillum humi]|uniref:Uncharacterized protein n=1 Tax=Noviherbaspirillum humi TaxID=1688639 RepID=A0A239G985_9BURK|nr:hypothetical protein [Noviherbaspirillum humi]SNS65262.1 hypothetical protein SAMN06265795_104291 [Noviherbaspirillum humi]